jgi:hypothetical protein
MQDRDVKTALFILLRCKQFSPLKRKKAVLFIRKEGLLTFVGN